MNAGNETKARGHLETWTPRLKLSDFIRVAFHHLSGPCRPVLTRELPLFPKYSQLHLVTVGSQSLCQSREGCPKILVVIEPQMA